MNPTDKRRKYGEGYALWLRNYQRARSRALTRLGQKYPDEYQELLEQERAKDEAEGKAWLDLSGRTGGGITTAGHTAPTSTEDRPNQANSYDEEDSELG